MDRSFIVGEIKRLAVERGGVPPGRETFKQATGIKHHQWLGVYWSSWSDAVAEAGFTPNTLDVAFEKGELLSKLAHAVRALRKYPTAAELKLHAQNRQGVPPPQALQRHFKTREQTIAALVAHCEGDDSFSDVLALVTPLVRTQAPPRPEKSPSLRIVGHVYLMRSGKHYKIGRSNHVGRREYQLALQLPEAVTTVHSTATDDPEGIEIYWHNRFKSKRANGEWFSLNADDLKAFKARRFM
jgi:hypothetical protein